MEEPINPRQKQQLLFEDLFFLCILGFYLVQVKSFIGAQPLCTGGIKTCRHGDLLTGISCVKVLCPPAGFLSDYSRWPNRKRQLIGVFPAASILRSGGTSVPLLCQRTVYSGQFTLQILLLLTRLQRGGTGLPATALPSPPSSHPPLPRHEIDLGLQARCRDKSKQVR